MTRDRTGWGHRGYVQCSPAAAWGWEPGLRGTCIQVHLPVGYTLSRDHRGWGHKGSLVAHILVKVVPVQGFVVTSQGRYWHIRRSSRGPSLGNLGRKRLRTSRCCSDLRRRLPAEQFSQGNRPGWGVVVPREPGQRAVEPLGDSSGPGSLGVLSWGRKEEVEECKIGLEEEGGYRQGQQEL